MEKALYILFLEDLVLDVTLVKAQLQMAGFKFELKQVTSKMQFLEELKHPPDLILSDQVLPGFDGFSALALARQICPEIPFIFVTGALGEEMAVKAFHDGATDFVRKDRLLGLVPAIHRAMQIAQERRKRLIAEESLRKSEARKTAILESALDAIIAIDHEGKVLEWNPAAEKMFGYTRDYALGREMAALIVPAHQIESHRQALARFMVTKASTYLGRRQEMIAHRADGSEFPVELTVSRIHHEDPPKFTGFIRDISHRKAAEAALQKSEDQFRLAVAAAEDYGIYLLDPEGKVVSWNAGAERIHGYKAEEVLGFHFGIFWTPEEQAQDLPERELQAAAAQGVSRREAWSQRKQGERFLSQWVLTAVRDAQGNLTGYLRVIHDVTERRRAEEQITRLNAELEERVRRRTAELEAANKELEAFSYSISHDLRAPLRHIEGFVNLLRQGTRDKLDATNQEYLQVVSDEAKQMNRLIEALLTFSRTSRAPIRKTQVDLNLLLKLALQDLRFELEGRKIEWVLAHLPEVQGDPSLLRQVFLNLLANALKYSRPREVARIEVSATGNEQEDMIQVRDNGVGFDMQYADKLFGVFQRLHGPEEFEGVGIGLANVRRIIQRHGGRVWAESAPDRGATFYFTLPKKQ